MTSNAGGCERVIDRTVKPFVLCGKTPTRLLSYPDGHGEYYQHEACPEHWAEEKLRELSLFWADGHEAEFDPLVLEGLLDMLKAAGYGVSFVWRKAAVTHEPA